jgi:hypothetical protein
VWLLSLLGTFAFGNECKVASRERMSAVDGSHGEVPPRKRFDVLERALLCQGANVSSSVALMLV